jgi:hypothetical protein
MKQFIILATLVTFLTACGGTTESVPTTDSVIVDTTKVDTTCCKDSVKTDTIK